MKILLISDVAIVDGLLATACFIGFIYLFEALARYKTLRENSPIIPSDSDIWLASEPSTSSTTTALVAAALAWCVTWYIRQIVGNLYTAIKAKYHLKDRGVYISSALL